MKPGSVVIVLAAERGGNCDLTTAKDGAIVHNMEDDVIRGATVAYQGEITFPPPPKIQAIAAAKPKEKVKEPRPEEKRAKEIAAFKAQTRNQVGLLSCPRRCCWSSVPMRRKAS